MSSDPPAGLTQAAVAQALGVRIPSIQAWEEGRAEPKPERLQAYRRLLDGLAQRYPAPPQPYATPPTAPAHRPAAATDTLPAPDRPSPNTQEPATPSPALAVPSAEPSGPAVAEDPARPAATSRRPAA
ncbi:helix-turn-helix domain-containing protein, partial [Streptomyces sp. NPDC091682]